MRYRIIIEVDTEAKQSAVNNIALDMLSIAVTKWSNPVYCATEVVKNKERYILKDDE